VVAVYTRMMEGMGERPTPLRDPALLESAILRPQMAAFYEDADRERQATLLAVGTSQNQPFVDGNQRAAYLALVTLLRANSHPFNGNPLDLAREIEAVAARLDSLEAATHRPDRWLREHID
jgi:death-on-curing protein